MATKRERYVVGEQKLIKVITDLNFLVVSLDRLGASTDGENEANASTFLKETRAFRRLVNARRVLTDAFDGSATPEAVRRLETKLSRLKYWGK